MTKKHMHVFLKHPSQYKKMTVDSNMAYFTEKHKTMTF